MIYQLKQRFYGVGDDFYILDESGTKLFFIDGYALSIGKRFDIKSMDGSRVGVIRQRLLTIAPQYNIDLTSGQSATVKKKLFAMRSSFVLDVPGPDDYTVVGKLIEHEYTFYRNKQVEAVVSRKLLRATDTYAVDIKGGENHLLILGCAVAIDMICHDRRSKHNR